MSRLIAGARARVQEQYGTAIGRHVEQVTTPALLLDLPAATRNIRRMQEGVLARRADLRPHVKTHKSPDLADLQVRAGAQGLSVATVWEAAVMAEAGFDDLFVVNTVVGPSRWEVVARLADKHQISVAVDDLDNARQVGAAARRNGAIIGALIEVDTGMKRGGLSSRADVTRLAGRLSDVPGLTFRGVTGYEGHCSLVDDPLERTSAHQVAMERLHESVEALEGAGLPCSIVSAGGTRTWWMAAEVAWVTEVQAGTYVLMDQFHSGIIGEFEPAVRVLTTVVNRRPSHLVLDAGSKSVADADAAMIDGWPLANLGADEEHSRFTAPSQAAELPIGSVVQLLPGYAPSTINLFDCYHVVEDDVVTDIWPIVPRGPGHLGLG